MRFKQTWPHAVDHEHFANCNIVALYLIFEPNGLAWLCMDMYVGVLHTIAWHHVHALAHARACVARCQAALDRKRAVLAEQAKKRASRQAEALARADAHAIVSGAQLCYCGPL
jgi:hypothetical protein